MQVRRRSVLETAAAARGVNVLQPRDHQAALSLYRDREGIAQFFLEEGWFARVTDPAIMYSYLHAPATEVEHTYDDLHA